MSRLGLSNKQDRIIEALFASNSVLLIAEDLTHAAGSQEKRNEPIQTLSKNEACQ